jgi:chaperonin GroES
MKFKPLGERALVKAVEREEKTASGIVLPDTAKEKPQTAEVVAVGDAEEVKVSQGDVIVFAKYSGTEIKLDGEDYMILDADDILGVVED